LSRRLAHALALAGVAAALVLAPRRSCAAPEATLERQVKAAFLYKFAGYVEWPAGAFGAPNAPMTIGVLGDDELADELSRLVEGRTSAGRPVAIVRLRTVEPVPDVRVLFVARGETERLPELAHQAQGRPILLVTESEEAMGRGAMINFVLAGGRVRFEVDLGAVAHGQLSLSSRLLAVAQNVLPEPK
jgi:hypothetical protein